MADLQTRMSKKIPVPTDHHNRPTVFIPRALETAQAVYVRHDSSKRPLRRPYDGPFKILARHPKHFIINKNGAEYSVSVDRLKPAIAEEVDAAPRLAVPSRDTKEDFGYDPEDFPPLPSPIITRSGRISKPPERLNI